MKNKGINVLSLFDGISCGQLAFKEAGIKVNKYYASEIEKNAIKVTQSNFPDTIQLGDVKKVKAVNLPKIDFLIGGSPCQGFSLSGNGLNFDDPRSKLFFEYVRLLKTVKPKYFLLENVPMKKEWQDTITEFLGVDPVMINSALLSAQNRKRLYWCNFKLTQPEDLGLVFMNIKQNSFHSRSFELPYSTRKRFVYTKSDGITIGRTNNIGKGGMSQFVLNPNRKCYTLTRSDVKRTLVNRILRSLTPIEYERLQGLPDNYTIHSNGKFNRYGLIGNGWTVPIIAHILKHATPQNKIEQFFSEYAIFLNHK